MKKTVLAVLAVLALASTAFAQLGQEKFGGLKYDVDNTGLYYCTTNGPNQNGKLLASTGGGSSATLVPATGSSTPFTGMAVGDILQIKTGESTYAWRVITTWTSASSIVVDSVITVALSPGAPFTWYRNTCGTAATNGWVATPAGATRVGISVFFEQGDITTLSARWECKTGDNIVIIYPGESSDCGLGAALSTDRCNWAAAKAGAADGSLTIVDDAPVYDACRVGLAYVTADASDAATNLEKVTVRFSFR